MAKTLRSNSGSRSDARQGRADMGGGHTGTKRTRGQVEPAGYEGSIAFLDARPRLAATAWPRGP